MTKDNRKDFRSYRWKLPADAFAFAERPDPGPTDLVKEDVWSSTVSLPDHVAVWTSDHHGSELKAMNDVWGDWVLSSGDEQDPMQYVMLDSADELKAFIWNSLCGFYRVAATCLRNVLELNTIGAYFQISKKLAKFEKWKQENYEIKYGNACDYLFKHPSTKSLEDHIKSRMNYSVFGEKTSWARELFQKLSSFTHSSATHTSAKLWEGSTGPIYIQNSFGKAYALYLDTMCLSHVLLKLARPRLALPKVTNLLRGKKHPAFQSCSV